MCSAGKKKAPFHMCSVHTCVYQYVYECPPAHMNFGLTKLNQTQPEQFWHKHFKTIRDRKDKRMCCATYHLHKLRSEQIITCMHPVNRAIEQTPEDT